MDWTRRRVIVGAGGAGLAAVAGCLGEGGAGASDESGNESEGSGDENETSEENETDGGEGESANDEHDAEAALEDADLEDYTGREEMTVTVDPDDGFDPETFEISRDTIITWVWEGSSTEPYPIDIPEECFWDEEVDEETADERENGDEYDRLFWAPGAYLYASHDDGGEEFTGAFRVVESGGSDGNDESDE